jgi:UDP-N-acetylmuramoyl-tripeptide--D-alanyl-D-alanine ligase
MARSTNFSRIVNVIFPFRDFLYLLQLEDYRTTRFARLLPRFVFRRNVEIRDTLVFTARIQIVFFLSLLILTSKWISIYWLFGSSLLSFIFYLLSLFAIPFYVFFAHLVSLPILSSAHAYIQKKGRLKIASMPDLKIVMIVGSFGKTTTRAYVQEMLKLSYRVETLPGNINTETGVAQWIARSLKTSTQVLIIEADAYAIGEIKRMCEITPPSIAIITALGDQHLDRLKTRARLIQATQEAFAHALPEATLIADSAVWSELARYDYEGKNVVVSDMISDEYASLQTPIDRLTPIHRSAALRALAVAHALTVPSRFVESALTSVQLPARRQQVHRFAGYDMMDDSYNISLITARAALNAARAHADTVGKKLLVVVAGIPESNESEKDNEALGDACERVGHHTIIVNSIFVESVKKGFKKPSNFTVKESIKNSIFLELPQQFNPDEWFVLLFNELRDQYH